MNTTFELASGSARLFLDADRFLTSASIGETPVLDAGRKTEFRGFCLDAFVPDDMNDRFPVPGRLVPGSVVESSGAVSGDEVRIKARTVAETVFAMFDAHIRPSGNDGFELDLAVTLSGEGMMANLGLALPLALDADPMKRKTTVGGQTRDEVWRLDQNDEDTSEAWRKKVSDTRARWPLWRVGGLLVDAPHHYMIWKSSERTTPPLPMDQGEQCPGWIAHNGSAGLRVTWTAIHEAAPAGFTVDGERGLMWIWLYPPAARPARVTGETFHTGRFRIDFFQSL